VTSRIDSKSTPLRIAVNTAFSGFVERLLYLSNFYWQILVFSHFDFDRVLFYHGTREWGYPDRLVGHALTG